MADDEICAVCGNISEGTLEEIAKLNTLVFGHIPTKDVVKIWYNIGYQPSDTICEECFLK